MKLSISQSLFLFVEAEDDQLLFNKKKKKKRIATWSSQRGNFLLKWGKEPLEATGVDKQSQQDRKDYNPIKSLSSQGAGEPRWDSAMHGQDQVRNCRDRKNHSNYTQS